jgi:DNA-binding MarR family transcriptional regulator
MFQPGTAFTTTAMHHGDARASERVTILIGGAPIAPPSFDAASGTDVRMVGMVPLDQLADRLAAQISLDVLWLCGTTPLPAELAATVRDELTRLGARVVCELEEAALDAGFAAFADLSGVQFLSRPAPIERTLALVAAGTHPVARVADSGRDVALERIDRLQDEVARISALLSSINHQARGFPARASDGGAQPVSFAPALRDGGRGYRAEPDLGMFGRFAESDSPSAAVRRMLRQRRMREQFFPADLFADPAWDMLLDLYAAQLEGQPVAVSSLCIAAAVPATTALRWIKTMTDAGIFERQADPRDGRRIFIGLAGPAAQAMDRYFAALESAR